MPEILLVIIGAAAFVVLGIFKNRDTEYTISNEDGLVKLRRNLEE